MEQTTLIKPKEQKPDNALPNLTPEKVDKVMSKIYDRVVLLAQKKPCVTGDYNLLTAYYYQEYYGRKFGIAFKRLLDLESPESICRAFRRAVEKGEITPSGKILKRRAVREESMRKVMRSDENE